MSHFFKPKYLCSPNFLPSTMSLMAATTRSGDELQQGKELLR